MKALQAICLVGAIIFTGMIRQISGNTPGVTLPDTMLEAVVSPGAPGALALLRRPGGVCRGRTSAWSRA